MAYLCSSSTPEGREISMAAAASLSDRLLYTTMCILGLPVEVQVKDGSLYSGFIHTACFEDGHGIVLKKAKKIGNGKCDTNLALGDYVDTLVVLFCDLVQVLVKECILPSGGIVSYAAINGIQAVSQDVESQDGSSDSERVEKTMLVYSSGQILECNAGGEKYSDQCNEMVHDVQQLNSSSNTNEVGCTNPASLPAQLVAPESKTTSSTNFPSSDAITSPLCTSMTSISDLRASSGSTQSGLPDVSVYKKNTVSKKFKLNPRAKVFTPSIESFSPIPSSMSIVVNREYLSNNLPVMHVDGPQLGTEMGSYASHSSLPGNYVPNNNLVSGQTGIGEQYARYVLGYANIRHQPLRLNGQYHHVQTGIPCPNPHTQTVMFGRLGQVVCVNPIIQDAIQGQPDISHGLPHPLFTPHPANAPKLQGNAAPIMQLCTAPPLVVGGNQTILAATRISFPQSFHTAQPIIVSCETGYFSSKLQ